MTKFKFFEDDVRFLNKTEKNWLLRFYESPFSSRIRRAKSVKSQKSVLSAYLSRLVELISDARQEINFLERFFDRAGVFKFVFSMAKRLAKRKALGKRAKTNSVDVSLTLEDYLDKIAKAKAPKDVKKIAGFAFMIGFLTL